MRRLHLCSERMLNGLVLLGLLVIALRAMPVAAAPCLVPSSTYPTIQAAVTDTTCATINLAAGIYTELVTISRDVTIRGESQESTIVDGGGRGTRVFTIFSGTVTIKGVTIRNGEAVTGDGGGLFNAGTLTVANSTITDQRGDLNRNLRF